jgi:hypothetical protein
MDHIELSEDFREALRELRNIANALPEHSSGFPQLAQSAADLFRVKNDGIFAIGTNNLVITLEPTERLREYLSAMRARNGRIGKVSAEG